MEMLSFRVEDMTCGGCAGRIDRALKQLDDGAQVEINVSDRLVRVHAQQASEADIAAAIRGAGYTPVTVAETAHAAPRTGCCGCGGRGACSKG